LTDIQLAGHLQLTIADAAEAVIQYLTGATRETIDVYDFGGPEAAPSPPDRVTLADLGRLIIINAELRAPDVHALLTDGSRDLAGAGVDAKWDLEEADPALSDGVYAHMLHAWRAIDDIHGIGRTKTSKLLHLKAPHAFPLLDAYVVKRYKSLALDLANEHIQPAPMYWAAIRRDLITLRRTNALAALRSHLDTNDELANVVKRLSDLRLIDILVWSERHVLH
jgi:hypothetical protein